MPGSKLARAGFLASTFATCLLATTAVLAQSPTVVYPLPGQIAKDQVEVFGDGALIEIRWNDFDLTPDDWALFVGYTQGSDDIQRITHLNARYVFGGKPEVESIIIGIPAKGETFFVRYLWFQAGEWHYQDTEYIAPAFQDTDDDGFEDSSDNCPLTSNAQQTNTDGDADGDACDSDDDNDTMSDAYELQNGLDPLDAGDADLDKDGDGLSNIEEFELGTRADNVDTDRDGVPDGVEVAKGANPLVNVPLILLLLLGDE